MKTRIMKSSPSITPWTKIALALFSLLFVFGAGKAVATLQQKGLLSFSNPWTYPVAMLIVIALAFALVVLIGKRPLKECGFAAPKKGDWAWLFTFLFFLMPIALFGRIIDPAWDAWYADQTGIAVIAGLALFSLTMPLYVLKEELVVRGIFQNRLRSLGFWWMAFAVSLNFAIAHYYVPQAGVQHVLVWVISVFVGSFLLIMCYEMTRNIWISILLHLVFNLLVGLQIFLHAAYLRLEFLFWALMMLGAVLAAKFSWRGTVARFKEERFVRISWKDAAFIFLFAVAYPALLAFFPPTYWLVGFALTFWIFFL